MRRLTLRSPLRALLFVAITGTLAGSAFADFPVRQGVGVAHLGRFVDVLEDPDRSLTVEQVASAAVARRFERSEADTLAFGVTPSTWWIRFTLESQGESPVARILELTTVLVEEVDFFVADRDGRLEPIRSGGWIPVAERDVRYANPIARLSLDPGESTTGFIRIRSAGHIEFALKLWSPDAFFVGSLDSSMLTGLYYGLLGVMILYNLFLFFSIRDLSYLYYVSYSLFFGLYMMTFDGTAHLYLWGRHASANQPAMHLLAVLFEVSLLAFTRTFLMSSTYAPRLDLFLRVLIAAYVASIISVFLVSPTFAMQAQIALSSGAFPGISLAIFFAWKGGFRAARFFALAFIVLLAAVGISALNFAINGTFVVFGMTFFDLARIGSASELTLLSFALGDRINILQAEKRAAQREALAEMERTNRLLAESERSLGEKVRQRTEELALARDRAMSANRAKSTFLASMSHELRTPLNAVMGYTELVLEDLEGQGASDTLRDLQRVDASARHLLGLISGILELTQIDAQSTDIEVSLVDVAGVVGDAVAVVRYDLDRAGNKLVLEGPTEGARIATDLFRLRQIVVNLLSNAVKFTDRGTIVVRWELARGRLRIEVEDSGPGIPAESLERVFERFEQLDPSSTRSRGGAGLGLAVTRRLVDLLDGELSVESHVGQGTSFIVDLPDLEASEEAAVLRAV